MPRLYMSVCVGLVLAFVYASVKGVVYTSLLTGSGTANKAATHYHK